MCINTSLAIALIVVEIFEAQDVSFGKEKCFIRPNGPERNNADPTGVLNDHSHLHQPQTPAVKNGRDLSNYQRVKQFISK